MLRADTGDERGATAPLGGNRIYEGYSRVVSGIASLVASAGVTQNGNTIQKSGTTADWDSGASSSLGLTGAAYVSATAGQTNLSGVFGLNADPATNNSYDSIDYAWRAAADGNAYIYENGVQVGTSLGAYSSSDVFAISYSGTTVSYLINGVVKRTTTTTVGCTFYFDSSLYHSGFQFNNIQFASTVNGAGMEYLQNSAIRYDALNRISEIADSGATLRYEYDANGNKRRVLSTYYNDFSGSQQTQDYWYKYDAMNRFTVSMGQLNGGQIVLGNNSYVLSTGASMIGGNTIQKSGTTADWNSGAFSSLGLTGAAYVSATAGQTNLSGVFGLNVDPATNNSYDSIDYAWRTGADGNAYIYENGVQVANLGTYTANDVFAISYGGTIISYQINGVAKRIVTTTAGRTFYFDSSLYNTGTQYNNLQFKATSTSSNGDGVALTYNAAGQRVRAVYARDGHREDYD